MGMVDARGGSCDSNEDCTTLYFTLINSIISSQKSIGMVLNPHI
jgi:hypothetical protein